jgi:hypothetical protein
MVATLVGARSARLQLEQVSGYNPLHLKHYVEYVEAMNGARQDYHWLDVYAAAARPSQLLNMLNVRFVLVAADLPAPAPIADHGVQVYRDDLVTVYENPDAFPRAWLVHAVRPNDGGQGLALLADGSVDGRSVAFVDGPLPPVAPTSTPDAVTITSALPERLTIRSTSAASGLLVASQPHARGWTASVDGQPAGVLRTDHALQGVPVPAGDHTVVLTYAPTSLSVGLWVTAAAPLVLASLWVWAAWAALSA